MKRGLLVSAGIAVLLAGCATTTNKVDSTTIASFQPGVTTVAQVEAALGQPFQTLRMPDGTQQLQYVSKVQNMAADSMATTGSVIPKRATTTVSTMLAFDQSGHFLRSWSSSKTQDDNKMPSDLGNMQQGDVSRGTSGR
ncbi:hypothetical protein [Dyella psychrodurans]|uniref:Outer membrane protein assembly factor BamE n=1 Tax=Dyella psychrodurans TaxID=1927960 RepID=A0A370XD02_9GAMM|nr:hypothetical protein [Dyella psychrodurans]RDS86314.1 hypothetical protein DWU99_03375 [Dyella psychrodurans]